MENTLEKEFYTKAINGTIATIMSLNVNDHDKFAFYTNNLAILKMRLAECNKTKVTVRTQIRTTVPVLTRSFVRAFSFLTF